MTQTDREAIAQIIDPDVMSDVECEKLGIKKVFRPVLRGKLLAKADAIIALLTRTNGECQCTESSAHTADDTGRSVGGMAAVTAEVVKILEADQVIPTETIARVYRSLKGIAARTEVTGEVERLRKQNDEWRAMVAALVAEAQRNHGGELVALLHDAAMQANAALAQPVQDEGGVIQADVKAAGDYLAGKRSKTTLAEAFAAHRRKFSRERGE
jgi:hypothetical protein